MKVIRVPWIVCRADEFGAVVHPVSWRGHEVEIMAYSEKEAREWWEELSETERGKVIGGGGGGETAEMSLF
jgi:hypothetical protein